MEQTFREKVTCINCGRTQFVTDTTAGGTLLFHRTNWYCKECHISFDIKVFIGEDGLVYQQALGSAPMNVYQAYNNHKIRLGN